MSIKKLVTLVSAGALLAATAGCGGDNDSADSTAAASGTPAAGTSSAKPKLEPIKFKIFVPIADPGAPAGEDPVHKYIREELGVDVEYIYSPGDAVQKLNLMLATNDYPDAIASKLDDNMKKYANTGALIAMDDYLAKYAPELKTKMDAFKKTYVSGYKDEKYWFIPGGFGYSKEYPQIEPMFGLRYDLWKEQGFPKLNTTEDLYQFAKKIQDAHPTVDGKKAYAFSGFFGDSWGFWAYHAMLRMGGQNGWYAPQDLNNKGHVTWLPFNKDFIYISQFLNRAYREGYADPEGAVQKNDQFVQKLNEGRTYINFYGGDWMDGNANRARIAAGKPEQRLFPYPGITLPDYMGKPITGQYFPTGTGFALAITKNCKNAEEIVKRLAPLWTDKGNVITGMGIEGIHWDKDEKGNRKPKADLVQLAKTDKNWQDKTGVGKWRNFLGGYVDGFDSKGDAYNLQDSKYYLEQSYDDVDKAIFKEMKVTNYNDLPRVGTTRVDWWLAGVSDFETNSPEATTFKKMNDLIDKYMPKMYLAASEDQFNKILKELQEETEKLGYKKIEDLINQRIQAAYEANKDKIDKY